MSNLVCSECGAPLSQNATVCSSCGCPVTTEAQHSIKKNSPSPSNILSAVSLLLGIIILIIGISLTQKDVTIDPYHARIYDAEYTAFKGDFYTSIYGVTDTIVDELSDINGGIESLSETMVVVIEAIYYISGIMVSSLGLGVIAMSCIHISKRS